MTKAELSKKLEDAIAREKRIENELVQQKHELERLKHALRIIGGIVAGERE